MYEFAKNPDESEYLERCSKNGIVGRVFFTDSRAFAPVDAAVYATTHSGMFCRGIIDHVQQQIGDLPPYACSRNVTKDFLTCLATAAADSSLLMHFLIFIFAILLSKLARGTPPALDSENVSTRTDIAPANSVPFKYSNVNFDANVDVENPPETPEKSVNSVKFIENYF